MISPSFHPRFVRRGSSEDGRLRCPRPMGANFPFAHSSHPRILSPIGSHGECQVGGGEPQDGGKLGFPLPFLLPLLTRKISGMKIDFVPTGPRLTLLSAPLWIKNPSSQSLSYIIQTDSDQWGIFLSVRGGIRGALRGAKYRPILRHS